MLLNGENYSLSMKKRHGAKATREIERLESTYLIRKYVSKLDLAIIQNPDFFPENLKKDRAYNNGVEHAKQDLKMLTYFLRYLQPRYRMKILLSQEFNNVLQDILAVSRTTWHKYTIEERNKALLLAFQLIEFSRHVIQDQMPKEFHEVLVESSKPFVQLVKAISDYGRKDNLKDIPRLESFDFIDEFMSSRK